MRMAEDIRKELKSMDDQEVNIFILSLLIRQKNMFDKIAAMNAWEGTDIVSRIFDNAKSLVFGVQSLINEECVERNDIEYFGWEADEIYMQIVSTYLDNLFAFWGLLQDTHNTDHSFSQCNFDLLESFIINKLGWKNVNEDVICSDKYMQLEYSREKRDIVLIREKNYSFDENIEMLFPIEDHGGCFDEIYWE